MAQAESEPLVFAIVVNWNRCELALEAVRSLASSDYPNLKIIVVDNGSTDGSADAVASEFTNAIIIRNDQNFGFAAGNNIGIERALKEGAGFVFLLNNDATVAPDTVRILVNFARNNPRLGGAAPYIFYHQQTDLIWFGGGTAALWRGRIAHQWIRQWYRSEQHYCRRTGYLTGCAVLFKADALHEIGLFDLTYGLYSEDVDLSLRLRWKGWELWVVPEAHVRHRISVSSHGEFTPLKAYHRGRSNALLVKRHIRWWQAPTLLIGGLLGGVFVSLRLLMTGRKATVAAFWRGAWMGLTGGRIPSEFQLQ